MNKPRVTEPPCAPNHLGWQFEDCGQPLETLACVGNHPRKSPSEFRHPSSVTQTKMLSLGTLGGLQPLALPKIHLRRSQLAHRRRSSQSCLRWTSERCELNWASGYRSRSSQTAEKKERKPRMNIQRKLQMKIASIRFSCKNTTTIPTNLSHAFSFQYLFWKTILERRDGSGSEKRTEALLSGEF